MMVVVPTPDFEGHRQVDARVLDHVPRSEQVGGFFFPYLVDLHGAVVATVEVFVAGDDVQAAGFLPL